MTPAAFHTAFQLFRSTKNWPTLMSHRLRRGSDCGCTAQLRDGTSVILRPGQLDWYVFQEVFVSSVYQCAIDFIAAYRREGCVFDFGANLGYFSLRAAAIDPKIQVHAFEPGPPHLEIIEKHLALNSRYAPQITVHAEAVGGCDSTLQWFYDEKNPGGSSLYGKGSNGLPVTVRRFATLIENAELPVILLKIDIEGAEYEVLRETPAEIWSRIPAIVIELHEDPRGEETPADILKKFHQLGFVSRLVHPHLYFLTASTSPS